MIKSFRHKGLERFFLTGSKAGITAAHAGKLQVRLTALHAATGPDDMNAAAWKLHPLSGQNAKKQDVEGHWSIWVTGNWHLTFFSKKQMLFLLITRTITKEPTMTSMYNPAHPGLVLRDYLGELSITTVAERLGVTRAALSRILNGHAGISADMAVLLGAALGTSAEMWTIMQARYDLWQAQQKPHRKVEPFPELARAA